MAPHPHRPTSLAVMSSFRTEVDVKPAPISKRISLEDKVTLMGSCFSDNMAAKLQVNKFSVESNPFGVSFHPLSLAWSLDRLLTGLPFTRDDLDHGPNGGPWFSYQHHSSFSSHIPSECLNLMNARLSEARAHMMESKLLCLTLGSAWAYVRKDTVRSSVMRIYAWEFPSAADE